ncbi:MAG: (2Fe-2S)-binding protein [Thermoleophilaceae bacterium]|nr:(2Fe-2S)-binding protein [Thermoleophilaceae bacterium]
MRVEVDGRGVEVEPGATILDAATAAGSYVPTLCFDERMAPFGACRVCMVGMEGADAPVAACTTLCREDMRVTTDEATARRIAAATVELVLSELPEPPAPHTELARVADFLEIGEPRWQGERRRPSHDRRHPYLALQHELCISCGRCVRACDEIQGAFALTATGRGFGSGITAGLDSGFTNSTCVSCGACADTCPTDAITEGSLLELASAYTEEPGGGV